jgi:hypothetical protein
MESRPLKVSQSYTVSVASFSGLAIDQQQPSGGFIFASLSFGLTRQPFPAKPFEVRARIFSCSTSYSLIF